MAKVTVPDQHGKMTEVELNPQGSISSNWCGKHAPAKPGICIYHECRLYEFHDENISRIFGVDAIFYCPEFGCDDFSWDVRTSHLIQMSNMNICCLHHSHDPYSDLQTVRFELFRSAALLKILFLKQRQMAEKLGLEVEKKI